MAEQRFPGARGLWGGGSASGLVLAVTALCVMAAPARSADPSVPPGRDPGGVAVALISTGIDYRLPEIASRLARDGEGDIVGWDFVDNDNRPFAPAGNATPANWGGDGTALVRLFGADRAPRIVPVRIDPNEPRSLAQAVAFVAQTPARLAVLPMWSSVREDWEPFRQAAGHFSEVLFVIAAGNESGQAVWPAGFRLANAVAVGVPPTTGAAAGSVDVLAAAKDTPAATTLAAAAAAACWPGLLASLKGQALKAALLAEAVKLQPSAALPIMEPCDAPRARP